MDAFRDACRTVSEVGVYRTPLLLLIRNLVAGTPPPQPMDEDPDLARIAAILTARVPHLPHVRWAICGVLAMFLDGFETVGLAANGIEITGWWRSAVRSWFAEMPLAVPPGFDVRAWERDLDLLLCSISSDASDRNRIIADLRQQLVMR